MGAGRHVLASRPGEWIARCVNAAPLKELYSGIVMSLFFWTSS